MIIRTRQTCILMVALAAFLGLLPSASALAGSQPYITGHGINFGSGNKYLQERDVAITSPIGRLTFSRTYNSQSDFNGPLGYGWDFSLSERLIETTGMLTYALPGGRHVYFRLNDEGDYVNEVGPKQTIAKVDNGFELSDHRGTTRIFDNQGRITAILRPNNISHTFAYGGEFPATLSDTFGKTLSFAYTGDKLRTLSSPIGDFTYSYDSNGNLITVEYPDGDIRQYIYDDPNDIHNLTGVIDAAGVRIQTLTYDVNDRVITSAKADDHDAVSIAYLPSFQREITDSLGVVTTYQLERLHGIIAVRSSTGPGCTTCGGEGVTAYTYDGRQQIRTTTDDRNTITSYTYDELGNRSSETRATGTALEYTRTFTHDPDHNKLTSVTEPSVGNPGANKVTSLTYDTAGNLTGRTAAGFRGTESISQTTGYTYDELGRVTSINGPRADVNDTLTLTYYPNAADQGDNRGYLQTITNGLGHRTTYSDYNQFGLAETIVDANGLTTALRHDSKGRVVEQTIGGRATTFQYTFDRLTQVSLPGGRVITYTYTAFGQVETISDTQSNRILYAYDSKGQRTGQEIHDPQGQLTAYTTFAYNDAGRLHRIINPDGSDRQMSYDGLGNLISQLNELGQSTAYVHDLFNRVTGITQPGQTQTRFTYDVHGNQTSVIDAEGRTTVFSFDDLGNQISRIAPDTGSTVYDYDTAGNITAKTDANGVTVNYTYDALNRLAEITYPDNSLNTSFNYDQGENGVGRLSQIADATGASTFTYDHFGNVIHETRVTAGQEFIIEYGYNANQELTSITYPSSRVVHYHRDGSGQVDQVTATFNGETSVISEQISHLPFGPATAMTMGNGLVTEFNHDQQYRLTSARFGGLYSRDYSYLANGQVQAIADLLEPANSQSFNYDDLGRLVAAQGAYGSLSYTYDKVGNRRTLTTDELTRTYNYSEGTNQLLTMSGDNGLSFNYDLAGNPTQRGEQYLDWNDEGQLATLLADSEPVGQYGYDYRSLRTVKTTDATMLAVYDQAGNQLCETDDQGNILREYVYLEGRRISLFEYTDLPEFTIEVTDGEGQPLTEIVVYGFEDTSYTGILGTTNEEGRAIFDRTAFGEGQYLFRADYLGASFWSDALPVQTSLGQTIVIPLHSQEVNILLGGQPVEGTTVYVFNGAGEYLGVTGVTDADGKVAFLLPEGADYQFRVDMSGNQYWSDPTTIVADSNPVVIDSGGGLVRVNVQEEAGSPMGGIVTHLYSPDESYLGLSSTTNSQGQVDYTLSAGSYKLRASYLDHYFWTDITVTGPTETELNIAHQDVLITVQEDYQGSVAPMEGITCTLFGVDGTELDITGQTDTGGILAFHLPEQAFRVRAEYRGRYYWSDDFTWQDQDISIAQGKAVVQVLSNGLPDQGWPVSARDSEGGLIGESVETDAEGLAVFLLPADETYRFELEQYTSGNISLVAHQETPVTISTGGGAFTLNLTDQDGLVLTGVDVALCTPGGDSLNHTLTTDTNGTAVFNLADGEYSLCIDYLGYPYQTETFTIPADAQIDYAIELHERLLQVARVYTDDQLPVQAEITLATEAGDVVGVIGATNEQGLVTTRLPAGSYRFGAQYLNTTYWSEPFNQTDQSLTIEEGMARVSLTDSGNPVSGAAVTVVDATSTSLLTGNTDENGLVFFRLPTGSYTFQALYQEVTYSSTAELPAHVVADIELSVSGSPLAFTVRTDTNTVLSGLRCRLHDHNDQPLGQTVVTNEQGVAHFDLSPGSYRIAVDYMGAEIWSELLVAPEVQASTLTIPLLPLTVQVVRDNTGESAEPLAGASCYLYAQIPGEGEGEGGEGGEEYVYTDTSGVTDEQGEVYFTVPDHPYRVMTIYMGTEFWTDLIYPGGGEGGVYSELRIALGTLDINITDDMYAGESGNGVPGATVQFLSTEGTPLGAPVYTDDYGHVELQVPPGSCQVLVEYNGNQYWSEVTHVLAYEWASITMHNGGGVIIGRINDPNPKLWHGHAPQYKPTLAFTGASMDGLLTQTVTQAVANGSPRVFYYLTDHLGTAQLIIDEEGAVVWQGEYRPFGEVNVIVDQIDHRFRFPGQILDSESGLYYNWHRYYDPSAGRYISADPIGLQGGINLYAYVQGDPVNWVDPWGLATWGPNDDSSSDPYPYIPISIPRPILEHLRGVTVLNDYKKIPVHPLEAVFELRNNGHIVYWFEDPNNWTQHSTDLGEMLCVATCMGEPLLGFGVEEGSEYMTIEILTKLAPGELKVWPIMGGKVYSWFDGQRDAKELSGELIQCVCECRK